MDSFLRVHQTHVIDMETIKLKFKIAAWDTKMGHASRWVASRVASPLEGMAVDEYHSFLAVVPHTMYGSCEILVSWFLMQCDPGYGLVKDGNKVKCKRCTKGCAQCDGDVDTCQRPFVEDPNCNSNDERTGQCTGCKYGYFLSWDGMTCSPCRVENCYTCNAFVDQCSVVRTYNCSTCECEQDRTWGHSFIRDT